MSADLTGTKQPWGRPFLPGQSGNPAGRPKGAKHKLTESFLSAIADDFVSNGIEAIAVLRRNDPVDYLKLIASLLPKELIAKHENGPNIDFENIGIEDFSELLERAQKIRLLKKALATVEEG